MSSSENTEYERRWLVPDPTALDGLDGSLIQQAYVFAQDGYAVRIRRVSSSSGEARSGFMTLKGPREHGTRLEYELAIPPLLALEFITRSTAVVEKVRYSLALHNELWDVDRFLGRNQGLIIAECEMTGPARRVTPPPWCGEEVTDDHKYDNDRLAYRPFDTW